MTHGLIPADRTGREASIRLVCLPFAGGGSALFYRWRRQLPDWLELTPLTLPGHDGRLNERPLTDLRALAALLVDDLRPVLDRGPFVLLGHSMGAWLAFEMAREIRRRDRRLPKLLVVAASRAPHLRLSESPISGLSDSEFIDVLERRYGGIPPEVRASRELLQLLLPALRADIRMIETYEHADEPPLETDLLALGGTNDAAVSGAVLEGWRRHTSRDFSARMLPGGHFFLFDALPAASSPALRMIIDRIEKCRSAPSTPTAKACAHEA
jgi:surfactin synthase thioesterase subunit